MTTITQHDLESHFARNVYAFKVQQRLAPTHSAVPDGRWQALKAELKGRRLLPRWVKVRCRIKTTDLNPFALLTGGLS